MPSLILVLLVLKAVAFVAVSSQAPSGNDNSQFVAKLYEAFDTNKDGKIEDAEAVDDLLKFDENKDNKLDVSEFSKFLAKINPELVGASDQLLKALDVNGSGQVEKDDVTNFVKSIDANADGKIDEGDYLKIAASVGGQ